MNSYLIVQNRRFSGYEPMLDQRGFHNEQQVMEDLDNRLRLIGHGWLMGDMKLELRKIVAGWTGMKQEQLGMPGPLINGKYESKLNVTKNIMNHTYNFHLTCNGQKVDAQLPEWEMITRKIK